MFNSPKPKPKVDPVVPHDVLHSDKLSRIKREINALKSGESLTENVDASCFNDIWATYKNETRNHRQGGLGKLQISYTGGTMTVTNVEPRKPAPAPPAPPAPVDPVDPVDPIGPDSLVFPEPDNG
jgi:hypothetical protein